MTVNLRLSLSVFKVGFAAESASGFVALAGGASQLPFHGLLVLLNPAFTALGILFLWVGRHEWNELHRTRVGHANLAFGITLLAVGLAAVPIAYLTLIGGATSGGWPTILFAAAVALVFGATFLTYTLVASHLVGRVGEIAMGAGLGWAIILSGLIGLALSAQLDPIVRLVTSRTVSVAPILNPITLLEALLSFSYLAFLVAFSDAHYRVARGLAKDPRGPAEAPARPQPH